MATSDLREQQTGAFALRSLDEGFPDVSKHQIEAAAEAMMRAMFAPHELPLPTLMAAKYREMAKLALEAAAAPELLQALKAVVAIADRKTDEFDRARAAIAKAEGRES